LTILLLLCISFVAQASVSGSFTAGLSFTPQTNSMEVVRTIVDLRSQLVLNAQVSGFATQMDIASGTTGLEHAIFKAFPALGGIDLSNQLAFATPFASVGSGSFTYLAANGPLLFVTERVEISTRIMGATFSNLAIYEDVNFMHPSVILPFNPSPLPLLPAYTAQSQSFRFGDIVTLHGQIIGGPTLTMSTGINADSNLGKCVQGRCFPGAVLGTDQGALILETISLQDLAVGPVTLDESLKLILVQDSLNCKTVSPFSAVTNLCFNTPLGMVSAVLSTADITKELISGASLTLSSDGLTITENFNSSLQVVKTTATLAITLNTENNPTSLNVTATSSPTRGLVNLSGTLSVARSGLAFTSSTTLSGTGGVTLSGQVFTLQAQAGAVNLGATVTVIPAWKGEFTAGINF
jgi:hypothetical protein